MNVKDILVEAIDRTGKSDTAVVGWGRGMGHKGHMYLASSVITQANEMNADPYFVVSRTVGKDDPITPEEKLEIYRKVFPDSSHIFQTASDEMPDLTRVLHNLNQQGYRNVVVVVGKDQLDALSYVKKYNGVPNKAGEVPFKFDSLEVISRQQTNDPSKELEGPRATPMRTALTDLNKFKQENPELMKKFKGVPDSDLPFAVWRDAMPDALSDKEVLVLMQKAQQRMGEFKPATKKAKVKEFIQRVRPMLKEANTAQKLKALKLIKEALTEFDAGEGGFGPFKLYAGDAHKYHHVDTFNSLDAAIEEVEFLIDSRPELVTTYWKIVDGMGEQVWDQDPDTMYDKMRSAGKMQFRKPGNKDLEEGASDLKKKISKYEELALAANRAGDDSKCKMYQKKVQELKQKMSLYEQYVGTGSSKDMQMSRDVATQNATVNLARQKFGPNPQNAKPQTMHYDHEYKVIPDPDKPGNYHTTVTMTPKNYQLSPNLTARASMDPNQDFDYFHKGEQLKSDHPLFNKVKQTHLDSMKPAIEPEVAPNNIAPLQPMQESSEDITSAKERLAYLEKIFDSSYEYSDDHSVWKKHNAIRQEMDKLKKIIGQDVTEDSDNPFELQKKHPMNHGMKKFMIRQIVKHTEYGTSELSLASDEELTQLFNEVVPNAQEVTKRFVGFLSEKLAEEKESRLYKQHQKIRKEKGLPDPSHYKKMAQQKQKEIDALNAEIAADKVKLKDDYLEEN